MIEEMQFNININSKRFKRIYSENSDSFIYKCFFVNIDQFFMEYMENCKLIVDNTTTLEDVYRKFNINNKDDIDTKLDDKIKYFFKNELKIYHDTVYLSDIEKLNVITYCLFLINNVLNTDCEGKKGKMISFKINRLLTYQKEKELFALIKLLSFIGYPLVIESKYEYSLLKHIRSFYSGVS